MFFPPLQWKQNMDEWWGKETMYLVKSVIITYLSHQHHSKQRDLPRHVQCRLYLRPPAFFSQKRRLVATLRWRQDWLFHTWLIYRVKTNKDNRLTVGGKNSWWGHDVCVNEGWGKEVVRVGKHHFFVNLSWNDGIKKGKDILEEYTCFRVVARCRKGGGTWKSA